MRTMLLVMAAGCNSLLGVQDITLGDGGTGGGDSKATMCIAGSLIKPCFVTLPTTTVNLNGPINTDSDSRCVVQKQTGGPDVCIIGGNNLNVTGIVRATGSRPLVLVAVKDLSVTALLDVSGDATAPAAGANTGTCVGTGPGANNNGSPGGGGGGGFGAPGALGGAGSTMAIGGAAGTSETPTFVRGGCDGGAGGTSVASPGGAGGGAGGSVYLVAGDSIDVMAGGAVAAGGEGGAGGSSGGGGGGGASGGMVGLDAPNVFVEGSVWATGGGGGGGGTNSGSGVAGSTGNATNTGGGMGATGGAGDGGNGGLDFMPPLAVDGKVATCSPNISTYCGGGGGGGGVGVIWLNATMSGFGGTVAPETTSPM